GGVWEGGKTGRKGASGFRLSAAPALRGLDPVLGAGDFLDAGLVEREVAALVASLGVLGRGGQSVAGPLRVQVADRDRIGARGNRLGGGRELVVLHVFVGQVASAGGGDALQPVGGLQQPRARLGAPAAAD